MNRNQERALNSHTFCHHTMARILSSKDNEMTVDDFDRNAFKDISFNRTTSPHRHASSSDTQNPDSEMDQDSDQDTFEMNMDNAARPTGQQSQATTIPH